MGKAQTWEEQREIQEREMGIPWRPTPEWSAGEKAKNRARIAKENANERVFGTYPGEIAPPIQEEILRQVKQIPKGLQ